MAEAKADKCGGAEDEEGRNGCPRKRERERERVFGGSVGGCCRAVITKRYCRFVPKALTFCRQGGQGGDGVTAVDFWGYCADPDYESKIKDGRREPWGGGHGSRATGERRHGA